MSAIRPGLPQPLPTGSDLPSVRNAQAAFFRAALDQAQPARAAAPVQHAAPAIRTAAAPPPAAEAEPTRYLRPGSLLDIKI